MCTRIHYLLLMFVWGLLLGMFGDAGEADWCYLEESSGSFLFGEDHHGATWRAGVVALLVFTTVPAIALPIRVSTDVCNTMKVSRLKKDELEFECGIRGHLPPNGTVKDFRQALKDLLEQEASGADLQDVFPFDLEGEKLILEAKLIEIEEGVEMLVEGEEGDRLASQLGSLERLRTVLSHCNRRAQRLYGQCAAGKDRESVKDLLRKLKSLVSTFREQGSTPVYAATSVPSVSGGKSKSAKEERSDEEEEGGGPRERKGFNSKKSLDFHKWGLSFSGSEGTSVLSFIMDLEEKAEWKGVDLDLLVTGASEFFTGRAKTWFRSVKSKIDSWKELKIALRSEFLPLDYYENLWEDIRMRKQGQSESIGAFVSNMLALFSRLEMIDEIKDEVKLQLIRKNLNPFFTQGLALVEVLSLDHLKRLGKKLEVSQARVDVYDGAKGKYKPMEPEFSAKSKRPSVNAVSTDEQVKGCEPSVKVVHGDSPRKPMKCWKCRKEGHKFSDCTSKENRKFCYRCGLEGVTVSSCPKCKGRRTSKSDAKEGE